MSRGIEMLTTTTLGAIIAVTVAIVLVTFTGILTNVIEDTAPVQACKLQVAQAAAGKQVSGGALDLSASCKRRVVTFGDVPARVVSKKLGDEMLTCGSIFNEGSLDFGRLNWLMPDDTVNCMICNVVQFEDDALRDSYNAETLREHWNDISLAGDSKTYGAYFSEVEEAARLEEKNILYAVDSRFDPQETNVIIFANVQQKAWIASLTTQFDFIQAFREWSQTWLPTWWTGGEDTYLTNYVILTDSDRAFEVCNNLLN